MTLSRLDPVSAYAQEFFRRLYHDWTISPHVRWTDEQGNLQIHVPSPLERDDADLTIYVEENEVTVCFWHFHTHFPFDPSDEYLAVDAVRLCRFIDDFLNERMCILTLFDAENRWKGSQTLDVLPEQEFIESIDECVRRSTGSTRYEVRSWRGSHDRAGSAGVDK